MSEYIDSDEPDWGSLTYGLSDEQAQYAKDEIYKDDEDMQEKIDQTKNDSNDPLINTWHRTIQEQYKKSKR